MRVALCVSSTRSGRGKYGSFDGSFSRFSTAQTFGLPIFRVQRIELLKLRLVCTSWKCLLESKEFQDLRLKVGSAEAWLYVLAEKPCRSPFRAFDPFSNKWFSLPQIPRLYDDTIWQGFACVAVGPNLLLMGGIHQSTNAATPLYSSGVVCADVHIYNACTNQWSRGASMSTPRSWFAASVIGDCVYVAGGQGHDRFLDTVEVYDLKKNSWSHVSSMNCARSSCYGFTLNGKLWIIGGEVMRNQHRVKPGRGSAEVYNSENGSWSLIPEMWLNSEKVPGPSTVHCGRLLCVHQSKLMMYAGDTNSWSHVGELSGAEMFSNQNSRYGFACESLNDELYIIGGMRMSRHYRHSVQLLNTNEACKLTPSCGGDSKYTSWRNLSSMGKCEGTIVASAVMTM
ncbi:hypothetical protein GOP47_0008407 [Adiantum capillus-veneris]|uniref:F-box/kelch-repeat protein n=1 Tax=Adiantum capillus-veneris TaxID=13818 RepID=A0A9D4ZJN4_ADICA|nr:hypothetical protein GOP47_0008407 [Adiantum capillus-veneris]